MNQTVDETQSPWALDFENGLTRWIVKRRAILFFTVILVHLLAFNGQWRLGSDSAIYRQIGHNLLAGRGFTYHGEPHSLSYPGLPVMCAAFEFSFGPSPVPLVLAMVTLGALTLVVVYQTLVLSSPKWVAVLVTVCLGLNGLFLEYTCEILTDIPFLFGVCLCIYSVERLRAATTRAGLATGATFFVIGTVFCVAFRPTFWIVVVALAGGCSLGLVRRSRWMLVCLLGVVLSAAVVVLFGPYQFADLFGGYSHRVNLIFRSLLNPHEIYFYDTFERTMPGAFFWQKLGPVLNTLAMLLILVATCALIARRPFWSLLVLGIVTVTLLTGTTTRYYLMVQPLLIFAWLWAWSWIALRVDPKHRDLVFATGLLLYLVPNILGCGKVIARQRAVPFVEHWNKGRWGGIPALAEQLKRQTPPDATILALESEALSFLADRRVVSPYLIEYARRAERLNVLEELGIQYLVLPADDYAQQYPKVFELIESGVILPLNQPPETRSGSRELWLSKVREKQRY